MELARNLAKDVFHEGHALRQAAASLTRQKVGRGVASAEAVSDGMLGTKEFQLSYKWQKHVLSPWHHLLYKDKQTYKAVIEIPKFTKRKMEVNTKLKHNPITQDLNKDGSVREYHGPIYWNYGMIPQTWEDPRVLDKDGHAGDNDPIDIVEISNNVYDIGKIVEIRPLGALMMLDEGELDWKIIAVNVQSKDCKDMYKLSQVPDEILSGITEWFRWYKTPSGKPLNKFGTPMLIDEKEAKKVIEEAHLAWRNLVETAPEKRPEGLWVD